MVDHLCKSLSVLILLRNSSLFLTVMPVSRSLFLLPTHVEEYEHSASQAISEFSTLSPQISG